MKPLTNDTPKPLLPVKDDLSLLDLNLIKLKDTEIKQVFISYSYGKELYEALAERYEDFFDITLIEDNPILGHGGVLLKNKCLFETDYVVGFNADTYVDFEFPKLNLDFSAAVFRSNVASDLPSNLICDSNNEIVGIRTPNRDYIYAGKKPPKEERLSNNIGIFAFSTYDLFEIDFSYEFMGLFGEDDLVELLIKNNRRVVSIDCSTIKGFYSMNTIEEYENIKKRLREGIK